MLASAQYVMKEIDNFKTLHREGKCPSLPISFQSYTFRIGEHNTIEGGLGHGFQTFAVPEVHSSVTKSGIRMGHVYWEIGHMAESPDAPPDAEFLTVFEKVPSTIAAVHLILVFLREELFQAMEFQDAEEQAKQNDPKVID
jgi:hypothetical protein